MSDEKKPNWLKANIHFIMAGIIVIAVVSYFTGFYGLFE